MKMKTTEYLYGVSPQDFMDLSYVDALGFKITKAKELLEKLVYVHAYARDDDRIKDILNAIGFNKNLLEELERETR